MSRRGFFPSFAVALLAVCVAIAFSSFQAHAQQSNSSHAAAGGLTYLNPGMPPVMIHPTVEMSETARGESHGSHGKGGPGGSTKTNNLLYNGGVGGIGVETTPKVYLVFWGSQWNNGLTSGDPSGEAAILESFLSGVGGSSWANTNTQYCQGVASGTQFCNGSGTPAGNEVGFYTGKTMAWFDNSAPAPKRASQSQLAAEAVRAEAFFANYAAANNLPAIDLNSAQFVIATPTGYNPQGFGRQYCAWHSYTTSSTAGNIAYTNLPYITDAGASCGANFNNLGANAGITIVEGHEMAETITDQFPSGGWLDSAGAETGDKCAWISSGQGASAYVTFPNGSTFPVQSLWSNAFNSGKGGCVMSY